MACRGIGVLDSGVGGLSVVREIRKRMPGIDIHYVGDSAWCPYGTREPELIRKRVGEIVDHLLEQDVSLIVIACNSATIHAVEWLRTRYAVPFVGMEPGVKPACSSTRSGVVGVLATEASISGEKFLKLVEKTACGVRVITRSCPRFVELVEDGILEGPVVDEAIREYVQPLVDDGADVLVLGCTHYPFLSASIRRLVPDTVTLIDTGEAVAHRTESLIAAPAGSGRLVIETSSQLEKIARLAPLLLGEPASAMEFSAFEAKSAC